MVSRMHSFSLAGIFLLALPAFAQFSITGIVRNQQGPAADVAVSIKTNSGSPNAGSLKDTRTDPDGKYTFDGLMGGYYELTFSREGFQTLVRAVPLNAESQVVDVVLNIGAVSTSVDVVDVAGKATSSRIDIPDRDLPVQVSSVTLQTLQAQGVNDMVTALRNVSGVTAMRQYGVYEYYTVRGFFQGDVQLVDGMRLEGNRFNTQLNNVERIDVLKGPSSILYGGQALGGAINIIRKKPQATRASDFYLKGGRFGTFGVGGGNTGQVFNLSRLMYRADVSYERTGGWRGAGAERFNATPSLMWLINDRNRVTVHQAFNHDHFNGDGGVPLGYTLLPSFDPARRFSPPHDFSLVRDSQTHVLFNSNLNHAWEFRNGLFLRRMADQYFVTESVSLNAAQNRIDRSALYFKHRRTPVLNQADVVGRLNLLGMRHTVLAGYEYQDYYSATDTTPGGGVFDPTTTPIAPISLTSFQETQSPITTFPLARTVYFSNRVNAFFWQDQIAVGEKLKLNIGGRYDDYRRLTRRDFFDNGVFANGTPDDRLDQSAYTYRAGAVYSLPGTQQVYFNSSSSFQPVTTLPTVGPQLNPETGQSYEVGHRWQGFNGRLQSSLAFYQLQRQNVVIAQGSGRFDQAGQQTSKGADLDLTGDLGYGIRMVANYGYSAPRYDSFFASNRTVDLSGNRPRFVQRHAANLWLTKAWNSGITASAGARYVGPVFTNDAHTFRIGGYTTFSGAFGYRTGKMDWSLNAENLFNRQRYFTGAAFANQVYPGAPINVFVTLRYRL